MIHQVIVENKEKIKPVNVSEIVSSLGGPCNVAKNIIKCHYNTLMRKIDNNSLTDDDLLKIHYHLGLQANTISNISECIKISKLNKKQLKVK